MAKEAHVGRAIHIGYTRTETGVAFGTAEADAAIGTIAFAIALRGNNIDAVATAVTIGAVEARVTRWGTVICIAAP